MNRDLLIRRVQAHVASDAVEAAHQRDVLDLLHTADSPFSRHHTSPGHITASAFVLSPELDRLLLIHHTFLQRWLQPGGHLEPDDAGLDQACAREVTEETGVVALERLGEDQALLDVDVHEIPENPRKGEAPHRHFDLRTLWRALDDRLVASSDVSGVCWVPLADAGRLSSDASVQRAVARIAAWVRQTALRPDPPPPGRMR